MMALKLLYQDGDSCSRVFANNVSNVHELSLLLSWLTCGPVLVEAVAPTTAFARAHHSSYCVHVYTAFWLDGK